MLAHSNSSTTRRPLTEPASCLPLAVPIAGQLAPAQTLQNTIPVGGVQTIVTKGEATPLVQGWTELASNIAVGGLAVLHQRIPGQTGNAAVVTAAPHARNMSLSYDNKDGALTSVALVNADASRSATLAIGLYDEAGALFGSELLQLPPRGQTAFLLIDRLPALRNRRVSCASLARIAISPASPCASIPPAPSPQSRC